MDFEERNREMIEKLSKDKELKELSHKWVAKTGDYEYGYHFKWMGRPIIQLPQDIIAMHEIIWTVKPDLIIETGIAHGGSIIFSASQLELLGEGEVIGIDIDIRLENFGEIVRHPMFKRVTLFEGSSIDERIVDKVREFAKGKKRVLVCLDSNHTHEHVLKELMYYSPLVTKDSYCAVFDTNVEDMPESATAEKAWGIGNNPKTAVWEFLKNDNNFEIDYTIQNKLLITVAPDGYLKRIK